MFLKDENICFLHYPFLSATAFEMNSCNSSMIVIIILIPIQNMFIPLPTYVDDGMHAVHGLPMLFQSLLSLVSCYWRAYFLQSTTSVGLSSTDTHFAHKNVHTFFNSFF